jgi:IS605 OrfB family transposase
MPQETNHNPHSAYGINCHLVWIPRYRKKVLVGSVEARLKELLAEIATQYGFEIMAVEVTPALACGASVPDHVHLFVSAPPKFSPAEIVRLFKGITSRRLKKEFESLRRQYWDKNATLWAEGYYVGTAGHVSAETIKRYIEESQKKSFQGLKYQNNCATFSSMKLIAQIKLLPTPEQANALRQTIEQANAACQFVSDTAWETKTFRQYDLHHRCYRAVREQFGLSAQVTVRAIAKVADAYKLDRKRKRAFKPTGSIAYDDRILSWRLHDNTVSIWTIAGRQCIAFACGERQLELLQTRQGESDLGLCNGMFFLWASCEVEEPEPIDIEGALGVDLGVTNIAVDSDGQVHSASHINNVRHRHRRLRRKLQANGTRSSKRKLKRLSGKERRFAKDTNHRISKKLVAKAKDTNRAIALEDLQGIRSRVTVRRSQRATLHSWAFYQLRSFVTYKAKQAGILVVLVNPRNTSRTCPACGHIDKANRPNQCTFSCVVCGFAGFADHIAAVNISRRAVVNPPIVARDEAKANQSLELRQSAVTSHLL